MVSTPCVNTDDCKALDGYIGLLYYVYMMTLTELLATFPT
jgi:hypothetical protein